ncbi:hypothetical protein [Streptomyces sp. NBC_01262]|jgi:hypothetical protein|uniref:hypothetical protein n=1 Tax=Streptomyces sp. NBC_01262 TaxID=2903803 RepID=UPI002E32A51B|nr:hypothetical protein [Streptomyces sp. NBC_01262]
MTRKRTLSPRKKAAALIGAAALVGGIAFITTGTGNAASVVCDGLDTALRNNQNFIADQKAHPDAQSAARIANREAVIAQIGVQQRASGCAAGAAAPSAAPAPTKASPTKATPTKAAPTTAAPAAGATVCAGSTVTLSGEAGAPAASSNQFPSGTRLKVTNLDNNKSITVTVTSVSGSCALLNNAAFEQVREPGKFLIRRALIQRVG